ARARGRAAPSRRGRLALPAAALLWAALPRARGTGFVGERPRRVARRGRLPGRVARDRARPDERATALLVARAVLPRGRPAHRGRGVRLRRARLQRWAEPPLGPVRVRVRGRSARGLA